MVDFVLTSTLSFSPIDTYIHTQILECLWWSQEPRRIRMDSTSKRLANNVEFSMRRRFSLELELVCSEWSNSASKNWFLLKIEINQQITIWKMIFIIERWIYKERFMAYKKRTRKLHPSWWLELNLKANDAKHKLGAVEAGRWAWGWEL